MNGLNGSGLSSAAVCPIIRDPDRQYNRLAAEAGKLVCREGIP